MPGYGQGQFRVLDEMLTAVTKQRGCGRIACHSGDEGGQGLGQQGISGALADQLVHVFGQHRQQFGSLRGDQAGAARADGQLAFPTAPPGNNLLIELRTNRVLLELS